MEIKLSSVYSPHNPLSHPSFLPPLPHTPLPSHRSLTPFPHTLPSHTLPARPLHPHSLTPFPHTLPSHPSLKPLPHTPHSHPSLTLLPYTPVPHTPLAHPSDNVYLHAPTNAFRSSKALTRGSLIAGTHSKGQQDQRVAEIAGKTAAGSSRGSGQQLQ